jgi:dTDP-4-amino-4,6-dideoxygalactose transaminase
MGPTFSKSLATPDPIPVEGQQRALDLMKSGALFRYTPGVESETALAEWDMCEATGFKYSVGFNSCGSALFIALKTNGVKPGDKVLANGFSFTAVPSAIHHAGATPVYVESTDAYVMDMDDLERKITPDTKYLMLTHMRGKVADMQRVYELAEKHGITVVEDCAHALGVHWDGVQLGRSASVACYSTQSAKVINSGEGGFFCTDDDELAAKAACYAGCYEKLYEQHVVAPPAEVFDRVKFDTPNYSLRMSDLAACCVRPQIKTLEPRVQKYNERYFAMVESLKGCEQIDVPGINPRVRPVCDSLQFNLKGMTQEQVSAFLASCKRRGMGVGLFGSRENARNFENWKYAPSAVPLPFTKELIAAAIDVRLPAEFEDEDFPKMAAVLLAAVDDALAA